MHRMHLSKNHEYVYDWDIEIQRRMSTWLILDGPNNVSATFMDVAYAQSVVVGSRWYLSVISMTL